MPNRIIKESICSSDSIDRLGWFEEVLFYRLIVNCDDYGRFDGRSAIIKNRLFPLKENLTLKNVTDAIKKLATVGLVVLYEVGGKPYLQLPTWNEHQSVRSKRSRYPSPGDGVMTSEIICKQMHADAPVIQSNPDPDPIRESESYSGVADRPPRAARFTPPSLDEVKAYCRERGNHVEPERFVDFYASKGWMVGKSRMKDWRAAVRGWENRDRPSHAEQTRRKTFSEIIAEAEANGQT